MSQHNTRSTDSETGSRSHVDTTPPVDESLAIIEDSFSMNDRPITFSYQVASLIGETLHRELDTSLLYKFTVNNTQYTAWEFSETASEALVKITIKDGEEERIQYARPPIGEAVMDLRAWLINSHSNSHQTDVTCTVTRMPNKTMNMILSSSPPEWQSGLETIIGEHLH